MNKAGAFLISLVSFALFFYSLPYITKYFGVELDIEDMYLTLLSPFPEVKEILGFKYAWVIVPACICAAIIALAVGGEEIAPYAPPKIRRYY